MDNEIINKIVETAHHIYEKNIVFGKAGNLSILDESGEYVYITASRTDFKSLVYDDVIKVNINDLSYESNNDRIPSMETNLHIGVYKKRSDVKSVVHLHSPYATAFAFSDKKLRHLQGFGPITQEFIDEVEYYPPGSEELAKHASDALKNVDSVLLKNHGVINVGKDIDEATLLSEHIEGIAKIQYITHTLSL